MPLRHVADRARNLHKRSRLVFVGITALAATAAMTATAFSLPAIERAASTSTGAAAVSDQPTAATLQGAAAGTPTSGGTPNSTASATQSAAPTPSGTASTGSGATTIVHGTTAMAIGTTTTQTATPSTHRMPLPPNGLAATPPMGWNDWYEYRCEVTEQEVLANAHALVDSGLDQLGYNYVNLDDCWMAPQRDASGNLQADPMRFPDGIKSLADQVHALGLKLGIYESLGDTTCQKLPGSYGHYQQDANTFASWGVDFLKFDYCGTLPTGSNLETLHQQMAQYLRATGRDIVFSEELPIAAGNANPANANFLPYVSFSSQIANMWRVAPDEVSTFTTTVFGHLSNDLPLGGYAHPGAWNDLDMLLTGNDSTNYNFNWTVQQEQTQMDIWAEMASPLIVSSDLTTMTSGTKAILGNAAVIAVDQDRLGRQGQLVGRQGTVDIVAKPLVNGAVALLLVNTGTAAKSVSVNVASLGLSRAASYSVHDLWAGTTQQTAATITATVPAQSATLMRVAPSAAPPPTPLTGTNR